MEEESVDTFKKICSDYITRPCSSENKTFWKECYLSCLLFKVYDNVETNTFHYCTCEPYLCKKYCYNPNHQRIPYCHNCKIDRDCSGLAGHWQHCIIYNCDACAFRHNLVEIWGQLTEKKTILTKFAKHRIIFLFSFIVPGVFGQPHKEKYSPYHDRLNFNLSAFAVCRCT